MPAPVSNQVPSEARHVQKGDTAHNSEHEFKQAESPAEERCRLYACEADNSLNTARGSTCDPGTKTRRTKARRGSNLWLIGAVTTLSLCSTLGRSSAGVRRGAAAGSAGRSAARAVDRLGCSRVPAQKADYPQP